MEVLKIFRLKKEKEKTLSDALSEDSVSVSNLKEIATFIYESNGTITEEIATALNISERSVQYGLSSLKEKGMITKIDDKYHATPELGKLLYEFDRFKFSMFFFSLSVIAYFSEFT